MPKAKGRRTAKRRATPAKRRATSGPQYVMRVNVLLTQEQYVTLQQRARDEGRLLPNLIRRILDLDIAQRK